MFLPELCPICKMSMTPSQHPNLLYFKYPEEDKARGPFVTCDACILELEVRLQKACPGRADTLYDGNRRVVFSIEQPVPFTREDVDSIIKEKKLRDKYRLIFLEEILPKLKKRAMRFALRRRSIRADIKRGGTLNNEVGTGSKCNPEPAFQDDCTTPVPSPICTSFFLQ